MNVLVIGKGGREHAIAHAVNRSPQVDTVFVAPGNPGTKALSKGQNVSFSEGDFEALIDFAKNNNVELTIVGPEVPLADGIADAFEKEGLVIFAPSKEAAQVESSKDFAKGIMKRHDIPTAGYETFAQLEPAKEYVLSKGAPIVIKEDGLKAGKGVTVAMSLEEALEALENAFSEPGNKVVIEDFLDGFEFSLIALVNGDLVVPLEVAQDHKRQLDGDLGPNTGGMGSYSPVKRITPELIETTMNTIMEPMAAAMVEEGVPFKGFLYGGLIDTPDGVKVIEFNARFGDPEAEVILPRLNSDFVGAIQEVLAGNKPELDWSDEVFHGVVLASDGYPASSTKGANIEIADDLDGLLFHMGTKEQDGALLTDGGRVLMLVESGKDLKEAMDKTYNELEKISSDALFYRKDIGKKDLDD